MSELNQLLISRVLGSRVRPFNRSSFGGLTAFRQASFAWHAMARPEAEPRTTQDEDIRIAEAFEAIRDGLSPDRVLADPQRNLGFYKKCRELGLRRPQATINRRLLRFRKGTQYIKLAPTTRELPIRDSNRFTCAADFAMSQLVYRHGASVDDMLADPALGLEFDRLAAELVPGFDPAQYRTAALLLRKTRNITRVKREELDQLHAADFQKAMYTVGDMTRVHSADIPQGEGIIAFSERASQERYLYVGRNMDLRAGFEPFSELRIFKAVGNLFWRPEPERIDVKLFQGKFFAGSTTKLWETKLIHEWRPIFNLPVQAAA